MSDKKKPPIGWKIYFWVLSAIYTLVFVNVFTRLDSDIHNYTNVLISLIALIGLYGYAYQTPLSKIKIWNVWFFLIIIWDLYDLFISFEDKNLTITFVVISYVFLIPEYIALYFYGYRSSHLWENVKLRNRISLLPQEKRSPTLAKQILPGFKLRHTLRGHKKRINRIAWSPDGRILAVPSSDRIIRLWDAQSGELRNKLIGHCGETGWVFSVAWSPDGRILASSADDKTIRLWDGQSGELFRTLKGQSDLIFCVAWSPDGRMLASGSNDKTVRLWDAQSGDLLQTFKGHTNKVFSVAWSPDGRMLASCSHLYDATVRLWDSHTNKLLHTFKGHNNNVLYVAWSPDGQTLASCSGDYTIRLWDTKTGQQKNLLEGHTKVVTCISFSFDNRLLVSLSEDETIRLWDCDKWKTVAVLDEPISRTLFARWNWWCSSLAFHPTEPVLATVGKRGKVIDIWELDFAALFGDT